MSSTTAEKEALCEMIRLLPDDMNSTVSDFLNRLLDNGEVSPDEEDALRQYRQQKMAGTLDTFSIEEVRSHLGLDH
jgi:hypothetical protein